MSKCRILISIGCRSDEGLSAPIIKRLREQDWCELSTIPLSPANYLKSYQIIEKHLSLCDYDLVLIVGDRIEMMACAQACFLKNIKIAHYGSGIVNNPISTYDDIHRHCISLMSDIAFCEDRQSAERTYLLWNQINKVPNLRISLNNPNENLKKKMEESNVYIVGISHLDDLEIDESLVPNEPYDLVLINPTTIIEEFINIDSEFAIIIESNPDNSILQAIDFNDVDRYISYDNLFRPQFLGLLSKCERFITNSSSAYYEAPYFLKPEQIIQIGLRNKNRSTPKKLERGASDKIVKILKKWWETNAQP